MFDFTSIMKAQQSQSNLKGPETARKPGAEVSAKPTAPAGLAEGGVLGGDELGQAVVRQKVFSAATRLRRTWEVLRTSGQFAELTPDADEVMNQLANLDGADDMELLRKMSRTTTAFRAAHRGSAAQRSQETAKSKFQTQAKEALTHLRKHLERVAEKVEKRQQKAETSQSKPPASQASKPAPSRSAPPQARAPLAKPQSEANQAKSSAPTLPPETAPQPDKGPREKPVARQSSSPASPQPAPNPTPGQSSSFGTGGALLKRSTPKPADSAPKETVSKPPDTTRSAELVKSAASTGEGLQKPEKQDSQKPKHLQRQAPQPSPRPASQRSAPRQENRATPQPPPEGNRAEKSSGGMLLRSRRSPGRSFGTPARASASTFMAGRPGESGHLMQASLPGERRAVSTRRVAAQAPPKPSVPPRGPATGNRPVTSHIPIFNPVLDGLFGQQSGKASMEQVEPIDMNRPAPKTVRPDESGYLASLRSSQNTAQPQQPEDPGRHRLRHSLSEQSREQTRPEHFSQRSQQVLKAATRFPLTGSMRLSSKPAGGGEKSGQAGGSESGQTGQATNQGGTHKVVAGLGGRERGGRGGGGQGQSQGQAQAQNTTNAANRARVGGLRLTSSHDAFRLSMTKLTSMAPPPQVAQSNAIKNIGYSIPALLKKLYRDQELNELDEDTAVNSLGLILKMGGEFTYAHSARVLDLAMELADEVGITDRQTRKQIKFGSMLKDIGEMGFLLDQESDDKLDEMAEFMSGQDMLRAGLLHDIGKIQIPKEILYKPGRLTEEEYEIVKMHPVYGEQIVYPITSLRHLCPAIRGHHERWDGKGYPDGLRGEGIPLAARVIAVADVFDALAAERPYKAGMEVAKVRNILNEGRGSHFDPDLVDAFLRIIERRYPELARKR